MVRTIIYIAAILALGCGRSEGPQESEPDFVGKVAAPLAVVKGASTTPPRTLLVPGAGVDLIQDILFRAQRDGWSLAETHSLASVDRMRRGGLGLVLAALPSAGSFEELASQVASMEALAAQTGGGARIVSEPEQARQVAGSGGVALMLLLEGADALQGRLADLPDLRRRGLVAVGLASPRGNAFADAAMSPRDPSGLTTAGEELLRTLVEARVAVDLTHASPAAFWTALTTAGTPVLVTHTASAALRQHPRNLDDVQILGLAAAKGLAGIVLNPEILRAGAESGEAGIGDVVAHLERWRSLGAISSVGLGTDFCGIHPPKGLEDPSRLGALAEALRAGGWSDEEILGVMGANAWRVLHTIFSEAGSVSLAEALRPVSLECDAVIGEADGSPSEACDGVVLGGGALLSQEAKQRLRLTDMRSEPVRLAVFGEPGALWQMEAQNLDGRPIASRLLHLDSRGEAQVALPSRRGMARILLSPTRRTTLREAVVWGRTPPM